MLIDAPCCLSARLRDVTPLRALLICYGAQERAFEAAGESDDKRAEKDTRALYARDFILMPLH